MLTGEFMATKKTNQVKTVLTCPDCGCDTVTVTEEHSIMVNTLEHYCHSVKAYDNDAKARCLECEWTGQRDQLKEVIF